MAVSRSPVVQNLRLEQALDSISDCLLVLDRQFRILYVNPAGLRLGGGHSLAERQGRCLWDLWPELVGSEIDRRYRLALSSGQAQHFGHEILRDGQRLWVELHAYPSDDGLVVSYRDATAEHRARQEYAKIERAYKAALSNTPDLVYVFDLNHRFIYANEALLSMWGRSWEEAIGKNCLELGYEPWHAEMHDREIEQVIATKRPIRGDVPFTGTNGRRIYDYIFVPVLDENGEVESIAGTTRDVTEHRQYEESLRDEQERLADLLQQAPAFVAVMSGPNHILERTNSLCEELLGRRDVVGKPVREAVPEAVAQGYVEMLDHVYQSGVPYCAYSSPFELAPSPGELPNRRYLNFVCQPMRDKNGAITGVIAVGVDVTEMRRAEEALVRNEKLAAAGRLAASISHEINNPLEAVTNLLYLVGRDQELTPRTRGYVETAQSELARVSQIATQTLRFYRDNSSPVQVELRALFDSIAGLYERRMHEAEIQLECNAKDTAPVTLFAGELRQVIANLVANAIDATVAQGRILLRSHAATDWKTGRRGVRISVADNGPGMTCETMQRAFDAFFSTKSTTGTGLGLWVSKELIEKRGGHIRVRSSRDTKQRGTVFSIFLPDLAAPPDATD